MTHDAVPSVAAGILPESTEAMLDTLHCSGFTDQAVVGSHRVFTSFLLGHLLLEAAAAGVDTTPGRQRGPTYDPGGCSALVPNRQPSRLCPEPSPEYSTVKFDESLAPVI